MAQRSQPGQTPKLCRWQRRLANANTTAAVVQQRLCLPTELSEASLGRREARRAAAEKTRQPQPQKTAFQADEQQDKRARWS